MKKLLILIFILFSSNNYCNVVNISLRYLIGYIKMYGITKKDILDNKQYHHIKIKNYIHKVHNELINYNHDFRKKNIKLFNNTLTKLKLTYNEIV